MNDIPLDALILNSLWTWATSRHAQSGHPYYQCIAADIRAIVRSYH